MNLFEQALSSSYMDLEEASNPMTRKQKQQVKKMQSSGWNMEKREKDKVVMSKDGKEVFIYTTGKTFFLSEDEEVDVTDIIDQLEESQFEKDSIIEEAFMTRVKSLLRRMAPKRTKVGMYHKSDREYIATASKGNQHSLLHVSTSIPRPVTLDRVSKKEVMDYIKQYESAGYKKVKAARDISGMITRIGPAILSYAVTGSILAIGYGAMVYFLGRQGMRDLEAISDQQTDRLEALRGSMERDGDLSIDEYIDNVLKELADKYKDRAIDPSTLTPDQLDNIPTIDLDSMLRGLQ